MFEVNSSYFTTHLSSLRHFHKIFPPFAVFLLFLLAYNGFNIFCTRVPLPADSPPEPANFSPEKLPGESTNAPHKYPSSKSGKLKLSVMYAVKEGSPLVISKSHLPQLQKTETLLQKTETLFQPRNNSLIRTLKRVRKSKHLFKKPRFGDRPKGFLSKVEEFFGEEKLDSSCKFRFFMTWISSLDSFGSREYFAIQSLFKSHPNACLVLISSSMDSSKGLTLLSPFLEKGFRVIAISPDFDCIFKDTPAESWFNNLRKGNVNPGEVALGQNISNLLRLALLYKFGGMYVDTDVILLKSFSKLRNVIGAQTIDHDTKNWSRLNNAVLIFDKQHPLLYKFIQEFALTFDGNKWGHNGPYLVSRVVSRLSGRPGYNFTVLPPVAFYPVDWTKIGKLFEGPTDENHSKRLIDKLRNIYKDSFSVHLWNRQSRSLKVEDGSVIAHIMSDYCVFCNLTSATAL